MKDLQNISNIQKGKLLHQLFPSVIPALLSFMKTAAAHSEAIFFIPLDGKRLAADQWQTRIDIVYSLLDQYEYKFTRSRKEFSETLFDKTLADVTIGLIVRFALSEASKNARFIFAVGLLFAPPCETERFISRLQAI